MWGRRTQKLIALLVVAASIKDIQLQALDVWKHWREATGEKARLWKKEGTDVLHRNPVNGSTVVASEN